MTTLADEETDASAGALPVVISPGWDSMERLLRDPAGLAFDLESGVLWGLSDVQARSVWDGRGALLTLSIAPPEDARDEDFPVERVRMAALLDQRCFVYPMGPARRWEHRNTGYPRALCLQHPDDDRSLLWLWEDGLAALITRVRVHLLCEEQWRRTGRWPGVALPHGAPQDGRLEPVTDPTLRKAMRRWAR